MKIKLLTIGKTKSTHLVQAIDEYQQRLKHYITFEHVFLPEIKQSSYQKLKELEAKSILKNIKKDQIVVLLDETGVEYSSVKFAGFIQKQMNTGVKEICFIVGGAYGFADILNQEAHFKVSLSKMTFTHDMVRLVFTEQLYRAFTILNGEKYHH